MSSVGVPRTSNRYCGLVTFAGQPRQLVTAPSPSVEYRVFGAIRRFCRTIRSSAAWFLTGNDHSAQNTENGYRRSTGSAAPSPEPATADADADVFRRSK